MGVLALRTLQVGWSLMSTSGECHIERLNYHDTDGRAERGALECGLGVGSRPGRPPSVGGQPLPRDRPRRCRWLPAAAAASPGGLPEESSTRRLQFLTIESYQKYLKIFKL